MRTAFKYIHFQELPQTGKTKSWVCRSNSSGDELGIVKWYPGWRQYCYFPGDTIYSSGCLTDIAQFLLGQNQEHKANLQNRKLLKQAVQG